MMKKVNEIEREREKRNRELIEMIKKKIRFP